MAIVEVKVPQLSESVAEATMLTWKKKAGEAVAVDEILIEIETDKVVLEVPAPAAGVLTEIVQGDGATVIADQLIAKIDTEAVAGAAAAPAAAAAAPAAAAPAGPDYAEFKAVFARHARADGKLVWGSAAGVPARKPLKRMFLHAWRLQITHPVNGEALAFHAPLPPELLPFLQARLPGALATINAFPTAAKQMDEL